MKRKIIGILLIFTLLFTFTIYKSNNSKQIDQDVANHTNEKVVAFQTVGERPPHNLIQNPSLTYGLTDSTISGWVIRYTTTGDAGYAVSTILGKPNANEPYRSLTNPNFIVSESNSTENFKVRPAVTSQALDPNNYVLLSYTLNNLTQNTVHTVRMESIADPSGQFMNFDMWAHGGADPTANTLLGSTGAGVGSASVVRTGFTFNTGSNQVATISIRIYTNSSQTAKLNIKHVAVLKTIEYNALDSARDLFTTQAKTIIKFGTISDITSNITNLNNYYETNKDAMRTAVRDEIAADILRATQQKDKVVSARTDIDNAYTDENKNALKSNVNQAYIDNLKARIASIENASFRPSLSTDLSIIEDIFIIEQSKANAITMLDNKATELRTQINGLSSLTSQEKTTFVNELNSLLTTEKAKIPNTTSIANLTTTRDASLRALEAVYLRAYRDDAKKEIDLRVTTLTNQINALTNLSDTEKSSLVNRLTTQATTSKNGLDSLTTTASINTAKNTALASLDTIRLDAQKLRANNMIEARALALQPTGISAGLRTIVDARKATINAQNSLNNVETQRNLAINAVEIQVAKEQAINNLIEHSVPIKATINGYTTLTTAQKNAYIAEIDEIIQRRTTEINSLQTQTSINTILQQGKDEMDAKNLLVRKDDAIKRIEALRDQIIVDINASTTHTQADKNQRLNQLNDATLAAISRIQGLQTMNGVTTELTNDLNTLNDIALQFYREDASRQIDNLYQEKIAEVDALANASETTKNEAKAELTEIRDNQKALLAGLESKSDIAQNVNRTRNLMESEVSRARDVGQNNIDQNRTRYIDDLRSHAESLKEAVNGLTNLSDSEKAPFISAIEQHLTNGLDRLNDTQNVTTLEELRTEFNNYSDIMSSEKTNADILNAKNNAKAQVQTRFDEIKAFIENASTRLTSDEKTTALSELQTILDSARTSIDSKNNVIDINIERDLKLQELENKYVENFKKHIENRMGETNEAFKRQIDDLVDLTPEKKATAKANTDSELERFLTQLAQNQTNGQFLATEDEYVRSNSRSLESLQERNESNKEASLRHNQEELATYANERKTHADTFTKLTPAQKNNLLDEIERIKTENEALISNASSSEAAATLLANAKQLIDNAMLDASKQNAKNLLNERIVELTDSATYSPLINQKLQELSNMIDSKTSLNDVETGLSDAYDELNQALIEDQQSTKNRVKTELENYAQLPIDANERAIIDKFMNDVNAKNYRNTESVDQIITDGKLALDTHYQTEIQAKKDELKTELENFIGSPRSEALDNLIQEQLDKVTKENYNNQEALDTLKEASKEALLNAKKEEEKAKLDTLINPDSSQQAKDIYDKGIKDITDSTNPTDLNNAVEEATSGLNNQNLSDDKAKYNTELGAYTDERKTFVDTLTKLTETQKTELLTRLDSIKTENEALINNAENSNDAKSTLDNAKRLIDEVILQASKINAKKELEDKISDMTGTTENSQSVNQKLQELKDSIDNKSSLSEVETGLTEANQQIEELFVSELAAEKNRVKTELEAYAKQPIDVTEQSIIERFIERVTPGNYRDKLSIDQIIIEGKAALEEHYSTDIENKKQELKTELENYIGTPRSEALDNIIKDTIDKLTKENYEDETYLETETNEAKEALLNAKKQEEKTKLETLVNNDSTQEVKDIYQKGIEDIDKSTNPTELNNAVEESTEGIKNQQLTEEKEKAKLDIDSKYPLPRSTEVEELINQGKQDLDSSSTLDELNNKKNNLEERIDQLLASQGLKKQNDLEAFRIFNQTQRGTHQFTDSQTASLDELYAENRQKLEEGTSTLQEAADNMQALINRYKDFIYTLTNGNFNIYDDNLRYPENAGNIVYTGINNTQGLHRGTTMEVSRHDIEIAKQNELREKFNSGTLTLPSTSALTTAQTAALLNSMEYVRRLDISLKNSDGNIVTDFNGTYSVSILIPDQYRNHAEFLVIFETANGIEVFKTYRSNAWLTFETSHFSSFYILGSQETTSSTPNVNSEIIYLISVILAAIVLLLILIIVIVKKYKKNQLR